MSLFDKKQVEPFISSYKTLDKKIICPNCTTYTKIEWYFEKHAAVE